MGPLATVATTVNNTHAHNNRAQTIEHQPLCCTIKAIQHVKTNMQLFRGEVALHTSISDQQEVSLRQPVPIGAQAENMEL